MSGSRGPRREPSRNDRRRSFRKPLEPPEGRVVSDGSRHPGQCAIRKLEREERVVRNVVLAAQSEPRGRLETEASVIIPMAERDDGENAERSAALETFTHERGAHSPSLMLVVDRERREPHELRIRMLDKRHG